jgi:hypothetical protein
VIVEQSKITFLFVPFSFKMNDTNTFRNLKQNATAVEIYFLLDLSRVTLDNFHDLALFAQSNFLSSKFYCLC